MLLEPFAKLLQIDRHAPLHRRVLEEVFDAILEGVEGGFAEKALEKGDMDDPAELQELAAAMMIRLDGVTMRRMSRRFIELGAAEGAEDLNRESLYKLHTSFRKSAKRAEKNAERDSGAGGGLVVTKKLKKNAQETDPALEPDKEGMEESSEEESTEEAKEEKAEKKASYRPRTSARKAAVKTLGNISREASSASDELSKLWESAPDVSRFFG